VSGKVVVVNPASISSRASISPSNVGPDSVT
jgi:hypothetical protein